ncbi:DUF975 family protein [Lactiplantibacillus fabifermentans]|uniref:Integral membrane protein n=2 Tax=Lactiplantibacillus fabifermentans TaxID=483011 RepID=A0A0R2NMN1_9LACO|nr:DUF975 family protein [Lactiplantibacillus fabifermentans]ETY75111.1 membrane protein [Lactiplantibacillus fabifermentans T30PCM01]KRO26964.1 integral membrane protein [Lactiplantibacillus fabifermentans DSM 21115]
MKTRAALKAEVKQLFSGAWWRAALLCLVASLSIFYRDASGMYKFINSWGITGFDWVGWLDWDTSETTAALLISTIFGVIVYFVQEVFIVGASYALLDASRAPKRQLPTITAATVGFAKQYRWSIVGLIIFKALLVFLWSLLLIVPGIIKAYAYTQTYFVYKDMLAATPAGQPRPTYRAAITRSRALMKGRKFDYFVLQLSFIGWQILAILTAGLGEFWLMAYRLATNAHFYDDLVMSAKR